MRILVFTYEFYPLFVGGLGVLVKDLVTELENQGQEVTLVLPSIPPEIKIKNSVSLESWTKKYSKKNLSIPNYELQKYKLKPKLTNYKSSWGQLYRGQTENLNYQNYIYPANMPRKNAVVALGFMDFFRANRDKYDVLVGMDWHFGLTAHCVKQEFPNFPIISYFNATHFDRLSTLPEILKSPKVDPLVIEKINQEKAALENCEKVIAVSDKQKQVILDNYMVSKERIIPIFNDQIFQPIKKNFKVLAKSKTVLFIGRMAPQKGLRFLIETAKLVVKTDPNIKFILAGDGISLPKAVDRVVDYGLENNVIFTGWVNLKEKKQLYSSSSLFVMPSPSEPFGLTPLEAIRSEVPVIASENSGFLGVVPSTPTFAYYDTQKFADMIRFYTQHEEKANKLLTEQKADLAKHSWSKQVQKIVKFLTENTTPKPGLYETSV